MDPLLLRAVGIFYSSNKSVMFLHFGQRKAQQTLLWLRCCRRRRCLLLLLRCCCSSFMLAATAAAAFFSRLRLLDHSFFSHSPTTKMRFVVGLGNDLKALAGIRSQTTCPHHCTRCPSLHHSNCAILPSGSRHNVGSGPPFKFEM